MTAIANHMPDPIPAESLEVPANEDNGNVPAEASATPPGDPAPVAAPVEPAPAAPAAPELFELPDGRKVDAASLAREFKENFLPDYTRKSQALAQLTNPKPAEIIKEVDPLADPEYVPKNYAEIVKIAEEKAIKAIDAREAAKAAERAAVENNVTEQLKAVKLADKTVDENKLFQHAVKYKFTDLTLAHQNMVDMEKGAAAARAAAAKAAAKRNDPVSVIPGASSGTAPDPSMFSTARDFLKSLQKS